MILINLELEDSKGSKASKSKGRYGQEDDFDREEDEESGEEGKEMFEGFHKTTTHTIHTTHTVTKEENNETVVESPELKNYKEKATKGIKDFDQYQKSHPMISQTTPQSTILEWLSSVSKAKSITEIQSIKDNIFDIAGYDILDAEEDDDDEVDEDLEDYDPLRSGPQEPDTVDMFAGINIARDDFVGNNENKNDSGSGDYNSGNDYDDDFEF